MISFWSNQVIVKLESGFLIFYKFSFLLNFLNFFLKQKNYTTRPKFYQNSTSTTTNILNSNGSANSNSNINSLSNNNNNNNKKLSDTLSMTNGPTLDINLLHNRFSARNIAAVQGEKFVCSWLYALCSISSELMFLSDGQLAIRCSNYEWRATEIKIHKQAQ